MDYLNVIRKLKNPSLSQFCHAWPGLINAALFDDWFHLKLSLRCSNRLVSSLAARISSSEVRLHSMNKLLDRPHAWRHLRIFLSWSSSSDGRVDRRRSRHSLTCQTIELVPYPPVIFPLFLNSTHSSTGFFSFSREKSTLFHLRYTWSGKIKVYIRD